MAVNEDLQNFERNFIHLGAVIQKFHVSLSRNKTLDYHDFLNRHFEYS